MLYSLFLLVIKTSTEILWSRKEKHVTLLSSFCGRLITEGSEPIPSKHRDIQHIHSVQHIQDGVHSIHHRGEQGQLQAWPQHHAFHNIHKYRDIHSVQHILDGDHNIHHIEEQDQLQPWPQAQPHAFQNSVHRYKDIRNVQHIQDGAHNILHTEEQDQPLILAQPQLHACQYSVHMYKDIRIHILDGVHNILHTEEQDQPQPWGQPLHRQQLPDRQWQ